MAASKIHPVILSGGSGTRLWPLSRQVYPKQLLSLAGERTMLQETADRVSDPDRFAPPMVICNNDHRFIIAEQLRAIEIEPSAIVLEPVGRNTAPAAAVAALSLSTRDPEALMMLLPSDHTILKQNAFVAAVDKTVALAEDGALVTFGILPDAPETGYGYIKRGAARGTAKGCYAVEAFLEKPDTAKAQAFLDDGGYFWNSGMFVFKAAKYLEELERLQPEIVAACRAALDGGAEDLSFTRLDADAFGKSPSISIDYAVMEHTSDAAVVAADIGWSDVGSWSALWQIGEQDAAGNVTVGDVVTHDVENSYLRSGKRLVAALGLKDIVVVETDDAVLVADRGKVQDVRAIVDDLKTNGRSEINVHNRVYRPWGYYESIDFGDRFQVKHIAVKPGAQLSLQMHHHRAEHWIVVQGTATVTRGEETVLLHENESTYIPIGVKHRLANPGMIELKLIEVQSGAYLGEDDIVRFEDQYGREGEKP